MAALIERFVKRPDPVGLERSSSLSFDEYLQLVTNFAFNGMSYQVGSSRMPGGDFESLVHAVFDDHDVVSAAIVARALLIQQVRFAFRNNRRNDPNYRQLFGNETLGLLERPDPGALSRPSWLATQEYHASLGGSGVTIRRDGYLEIVSPDSLDCVIQGVDDADRVMRRRAGRKIGYVFYPHGKEHPETSEPLLLSEVAHWYPEPHPLAWWTGQSWVVSVLSQVVTDKAATKYLRQFFDKAATPNIIVKPHERLSPEQVDEYREVFTKETAGVSNAFKTMWLGAGSEVEVVGSRLADLDLKSVTGGAETRIALRSRVPAPILGIREGLAGSSLNAGNYGSARRMFADGWFTPSVQSLCAALEAIVPPPPGSELWYDPADVLFLQEDALDSADILAKQATALQALDSAGYNADAAVKAVKDGNLAALIGNHDGLQSVQRLPTDEGTDEDA